MARVTREQAEKLRVAVAKHAAYFHHLRRRMLAAGIDPTDEICQKTLKACDVLQDLTMTAHYRSCASGVALPAEAQHL